ncbi:unnamed protein product [Symbiodinium natans]|uniref:Uncharacterized protein n=1 Tax=Symbiodinium natans TaxID=878477 RepID=A0A812LXA1_9DINO|nr:unnamed protein product [Symbiodinium natans]
MLDQLKDCTHELLNGKLKLDAMAAFCPPAQATHMNEVRVQSDKKQENQCHEYGTTDGGKELQQGQEKAQANEERLGPFCPCFLTQLTLTLRPGINHLVDETRSRSIFA